MNIYCELYKTKHYNNKGRKDEIGKKVFIYNTQPPYQSMALEYLVRCLCIRKVSKSSPTWCQWPKTSKNEMPGELVSERKVTE